MQAHKLPAPLNRAETERLLDMGHVMYRHERHWHIDGRPIHGNAARVALADGIRNKTMTAAGTAKWKRAAKREGTYCERIIEHISNNNVAEAIRMLKSLDEQLLASSGS